MRALRDSSFCTSRKIVHTFLSYFPWTFQPSQETLKTMLMQNFGGGGRGGDWFGRCIMGDVQMANKENIRICVGEKVCNSHGKSENLIIIIFK